jgi:hypothetical protein
VEQALRARELLAFARLREGGEESNEDGYHGGHGGYPKHRSLSLDLHLVNARDRGRFDILGADKLKPLFTALDLPALLDGTGKEQKSKTVRQLI